MEINPYSSLDLFGRQIGPGDHHRLMNPSGFSRLPLRTLLPRSTYGRHSSCSSSASSSQLIVSQPVPSIPPLSSALYQSKQDQRIRLPSAAFDPYMCYAMPVVRWLLGFPLKKKDPTKSEILFKTTHSVKLEFHVAKGPRRPSPSLPHKSIHPTTTLDKK